MQHVILPLTAPTRVRDLEGLKICFTEAKDKIDGYYQNFDHAMQAAEALAVKNPTQQYAVCSVVAVVETTTPKIVTKKYNDAGELLVDKQ